MIRPKQKERLGLAEGMARHDRKERLGLTGRNWPGLVERNGQAWWMVKWLGLTGRNGMA
jgi:hypothetical protein